MLLALALLVGTPTGWQLPDQATQVQVLRNGTTPFVAVADVLPTERIKACNAELPIGSEDACPKEGRAPGRTDVWWLKSDIYATPAPEPPPARKIVTVRWGPPRNPDGTEYTDVLGYKITIRRQDCDPTRSGCPSSTQVEEHIRAPEARSYVVENVVYTACATVQAFNSAGDGPIHPEVCPQKKPPPAVSDLRAE